MDRENVGDGVERAGSRESKDAAIRQREVRFARQAEGVVEECVLGHADATIDDERAANGVHPRFRSRENERIASVHERIVDGFDKHILRGIPGSQQQPFGSSADVGFVGGRVDECVAVRADCAGGCCGAVNCGGIPHVAGLQPGHAGNRVNIAVAVCAERNGRSSRAIEHSRLVGP